MTKARQRANEAYPDEDDAWVESNIDRRIGYKQGYEQAEKDLALKWKDIETIRVIIDRVEAEHRFRPMSKGVYEEVLKQFKEKRYDSQ